MTSEGLKLRPSSINSGTTWNNDGTEWSTGKDEMQGEGGVNAHVGIFIILSFIDDCRIDIDDNNNLRAQRKCNIN